jgi:hypothetical protein
LAHNFKKPLPRSVLGFDTTATSYLLMDFYIFGWRRKRRKRRKRRRRRRKMRRRRRSKEEDLLIARRKTELFQRYVMV